MVSLSGFRAAPGWSGAPRLVDTDDLLVERALGGDSHAQRTLVARVATTLRAAGGAYLETAEKYLDSGGSLEGSARALFVHANTVRYRLGRIAEMTGYDLTDPRESYAARVALSLARLRTDL